MKKFVFNIPTKIIFGTGEINEFDKYLNSEFDNVLIVTDKAVSQKSGAVDKILEKLKDRETSIIDETEENPSFDFMEKCAQHANIGDKQVVIGVGGGSCMDAAKGIALLAKNNDYVTDLIAGKPLKNDPLPIICIPTTSGSGSEVTPYAVFTDLDNEAKMGYYHEKIFPKLSVIDPELTYSMPEHLVVNTGLDALTHSLEAYLSTESFFLNDMLALHSMEIVIDNLKQARMKVKGAMDKMAYAAMVGGIVIANSGTILLHIMAYPLTVFYKIPHGKANAILLPEFLKFMKAKSSVKEKVEVIEKMFLKEGGIDNFINSFDISTKLSDYGIGESELKVFAEKTIVKSDIEITPAAISEFDILEIYKSAAE